MVICNFNMGFSALFLLNLLHLLKETSGSHFQKNINSLVNKTAKFCFYYGIETTFKKKSR